MIVVERKDRDAHGAISITSIDLSLSLNCASFICTKTTITIYHFLHIATEILKLWINFFCLFCFVSSVFLSFSSKTYIRTQRAWSEVEESKLEHRKEMAEESMSEVTTPVRQVLLISAGASHSVALLCKLPSF